MEFGINKCKILYIKKEKWKNETTRQTLNNKTLHRYNKIKYTKYLGFFSEYKIKPYINKTTATRVV